MNSAYLAFQLNRIFFIFVCFFSFSDAAVLPIAISPGGVEPSCQRNITLPETASDYFSIALMMERALVSEDGAQVNVLKIKLLDVVKHPYLTKEFLNQVVEKLQQQQIIEWLAAEVKLNALTIGPIQYLADKMILDGSFQSKAKLKNPMKIRIFNNSQNFTRGEIQSGNDGFIEIANHLSLKKESFIQGDIDFSGIYNE